MERFRFGLETVLNYKTQVLESLKTEHAFINRRVMDKQEEIHQLGEVLNGYHKDFDHAKGVGDRIENYRLYDMCIGRMEEILDQEKQKLAILKEDEERKKKEVVEAKVDSSKFEKLRSRRLQDYNKAQLKAEENFVEEFVSQNVSRNQYQNRS